MGGGGDGLGQLWARCGPMQSDLSRWIFVSHSASAAESFCLFVCSGFSLNLFNPPAFCGPVHHHLLSRGSQQSVVFSDYFLQNSTFKKTVKLGDASFIY